MPDQPESGWELALADWIGLAASLIHLAIDGIGDRADAHQWLDALTEAMLAGQSE
ncbi:MAG TPA: hypothetical protein VHX38_15060 [Pseudonocardiaceae bacterium]|jgi:hypothetical protein|nr:hypothetical protein [Pseudonocardiaceae bacterium]